MMASSRELVYRREERLLHLYGAAKMRQGRQELQAGQITLELDAEMRAQRLVARDHPELHNPNDRSDVSLSADELAAPLGRGGQPERVIATGHVVLNARRAGGQDQLQAAWSDLAQARGKLANRLFLEKAPAEVVAGQKARAAELSALVDKLATRLTELGG